MFKKKVDMSKRMFEIMDEMNLSDVKNDTSLIKVSTSLLSAKKIKQGAKITIGIDEQCMNEIAFEKSMAVLVIVDKEEYFKKKVDMETIKNTTPKARKQHRCDYCYSAIDKGEVYDHQTNKIDGDLYTWKSHKKCTKIASDLKMYDHKYEGLTGDDFHEGINEWYDMLDGESGKTFEEILNHVIKNNHKIKR